MEDAATAEISRAQVWPWVQRGRFDEARVREEIAAVEAARRGEGALRRGRARRSRVEEFLDTRRAYDRLLPVKPRIRTKADEIALLLEEAIVSGELAPGLGPPAGAGLGAVRGQRTPVREALRRLAALGLVSFEPNRGFRVRTLSHEELWEAFLLRAELESLVHGSRRGR